MKVNHFLLFLTCVVCTRVAQAQNNACYAEVNVDPIILTEEINHYIFTGEDTTGLNVKKTLITVSPARKETIRKRKSKDCNAPNPADCYTLVETEVPAVTMNLFTLPEPPTSDQYDLRKEVRTTIVREGGMVTKEVLCQKEINQKLVEKIQKLLLKQGYLSEKKSVNGLLDTVTLSALTAFQKKNKLAYGALTIETIEFIAQN